MRRYGVLGCVLICLVGAGYASEGGRARLEEALVISAPPSAAPIRLYRGDVLACHSISKTNGDATVLLLGADAAVWGATVPFRDEWGRTLFRAWTSDSALPAGTLRLESDVDAHPSSFVLPAGTEVSITGTQGLHGVIVYRLGGASFPLLAPLASLRAIVPPTLTREERLRDRLAARIETLKEENEKLASRALLAEATLLELQGLTMERNALLGLNRRLAAETWAAEDWLAGAVTDMLRDRQPPNVDKLLRELAAWQALRRKERTAAEIRVAAIEQANEAVDAMRVDGVQIEASALQAESTLKALSRAEAREQFEADVRRAVDAIRALLLNRVDADATVAETRTRLNALAALEEILVPIVERNEQSDRDFQAMTDDIERIKALIEAIFPTPTAEAPAADDAVK